MSFFVKVVDFLACGGSFIGHSLTGFIAALPVA